MSKLWNFLLLLALLTAVSCASDSKDSADERSAVQQITDKTAQQAVDAINSPINKAKKVQGLVDENTQRQQEMMGELKE